MPVHSRAEKIIIKKKPNTNTNAVVFKRFVTLMAVVAGLFFLSLFSSVRVYRTLNGSMSKTTGGLVKKNTTFPG